MKRLIFLLAASSVGLLLSIAPLRGRALDADAPDWANPSRVTLKNVVPPHVPERYHTLGSENYECQDMLDGCFISTAFGMQDVESNRAVFYGTDNEALPLAPHIGGQVLIGWPHTDTVLAFTSIPTGGSQIGMYRSFTSTLVDRTNLLGQVTNKYVSRSADLILSDNDGKKLLFNANTLAFSDNGSWLVVETFNAGFVRINLATLDVLHFAPKLSSSSSSFGLKESQLAVSDDGQFVALANRTAGIFKVYDMLLCTSLVCAAHEYYSFLATQLPTGFVPVHLRFLHNGLLGFRAFTGPLESSYLLTPTDKIDSQLSYLGLGDSYAAGEGVGQYRSGTDTSTNKCHLSAGSYPFLVRDALFTTTAGNSVACSGSRIHDIESGKQVDLDSNDARLMLRTFTPGHLSQAAFVGRYQPAIITAEVGGNDIGFGSIVAECVIPKARSNNSCYSTYEDRLELARLIDRTMPRLRDLYKKLQSRAPLGKLYVLGYPQIVTPGNCASNVQLNASEVQLAVSLINQLNAAISEAAAQAKVEYIDVSQAFVGHRLCETNSSRVAVDGITFGNDAGLSLPKSLGGGKIRTLSGGSYHPNAFGQLLLSQVIIDHLRNPNTTVRKPYMPAASSGSELLNAPKANRTPIALQFIDFTERNITQDSSLTIKLPGLRMGLKPNTDYDVRLDGPEGITLGKVRSDSNANVYTVVPLPVMYDGGYTVDIIGPNHAAETTDIRQVITVEDPANSSSNAEPDILPGPQSPGTTSEVPMPTPTSAASFSSTSPSLQGTTLANRTRPPGVTITPSPESQAVIPHSNVPHMSEDKVTSKVWPSPPKIHWLTIVYVVGGLVAFYAVLRLYVPAASRA